MTCIATDGKTIAGDGLTTAGWTIIGTDAVKVRLLGEVGLYGASGSPADCMAAGLWLHNPTGERPPLGEDFAALLVTPDGKTFRLDPKLLRLEVYGPAAIGCGADFALAAMDMGATPEHAVRIACQRSTHCGGKVTSIGF